MHKYIELLECEIEKLIAYEKHSCKLHWETEQKLHVLFENCKHAKEYKMATKSDADKKNPY